MAQYPVAVIKIAMQLHVPDGDQAVEPGVGDRVHGLREAVLGNPLFQGFRLDAMARGKARPAMMATSPFSVMGSIFLSVRP